MTVLLVFSALVLSVDAAVRDVPLGECHGCEVTCFEDCALKYDREIMQELYLLQTEEEQNRAAKVTDEYANCLIEDKCPCDKEEKKAKAAQAAKGKSSLLQKKGNATCAVGDVPCAQKCSRKVISKTEASLKAKASSKQALIQRDYPIHSVTVGVFSKGAMNADNCLKFCLAATCGCDGVKDLDTIDRLVKAIKKNDAVSGGVYHPVEEAADHKGGVVDTHRSAQFRPAEVTDCAKGMIGKKVSKGLYIDFGEGVGGEVEICSTKFLEKIFGPGDHSKQDKLCKSKKSDDAQWGCVWDDTKGKCVVGFSKNLVCQKKYFDDPSRF
jgi:hypothetical protein